MKCNWCWSTKIIDNVCQYCNTKTIIKKLETKTTKYTEWKTLIWNNNDYKYLKNCKVVWNNNDIIEAIDCKIIWNNNDIKKEQWCTVIWNNNDY